jgi:hypothetical protein
VHCLVLLGVSFNQLKLNRVGQLISGFGMNQRAYRKWALLLLTGQVLTPTGSTQTISNRSEGPLQHQFRGTLGSNRIGMTVVRKGEQVQSGHCFYQKYLEDIPLTGSEKDFCVVLNEPVVALSSSVLREMAARATRS